MNLTPLEFDLLSDFVISNTGIELTEEKIYLIEHRFMPLLKSLECSSFASLYKKGCSDNAVKQAMVNAICTNETLFFRDNYPFKMLTEVFVPAIEQINREGAISIQSAACSSGQEALSMAIALNETNRDLSRFNIVGTDISEEILSKAREATYSQFELGRGLPEPLQKKYFDSQGSRFRPSESLRRQMSFKKVNLLEHSADVGFYDIIFCRNVACYFNLETKQVLFSNLAKQLKPHGFLVVGASDNLERETDLFRAHSFEGAKYYTLRSLH